MAFALQTIGVTNVVFVLLGELVVCHCSSKGFSPKDHGLFDGQPNNLESTRN